VAVDDMEALLNISQKMVSPQPTSKFERTHCQLFGMINIENRSNWFGGIGYCGVGDVVRRHREKIIILR